MKKLIILVLGLSVLLGSGNCLAVGSNKTIREADRIFRMHPELKTAKYELVPISSEYLHREGTRVAVMGYLPYTNTIYIYESVRPIIMYSSMTHEFGHWNWFNVLTFDQQDEWIDMFVKNRRCPSTYGQTDYEECFAEYFSLYKYGTRGKSSFAGVEELLSTKYPEVRFLQSIFPKNTSK